MEVTYRLKSIQISIDYHSPESNINGQMCTKNTATNTFHFCPAFITLQKLHLNEREKTILKGFYTKDAATNTCYCLLLFQKNTNAS